LDRLVDTHNKYSCWQAFSLLEPLDISVSRMAYILFSYIKLPN
jgi:hypothetical protein